MKITFVSYKGCKERWVSIELPSKETNPFYNEVKDGESIPTSALSNFASLAPKSKTLNELKNFVLDSLLDGYKELKYFY